MAAGVLSKKSKRPFHFLRLNVDRCCRILSRRSPVWMAKIDADRTTRSVHNKKSQARTRWAAAGRRKAGCQGESERWQPPSWRAPSAWRRHQVSNSDVREDFNADIVAATRCSNDIRSLRAKAACRFARLPVLTSAVSNETQMIAAGGIRDRSRRTTL